LQQIVFEYSHTQTVDVNEILMVGKVWTQVQNHWSSSKVIMDSKTILWNGPLGVFEMENFAHGTIALGNFIAESTANGAFSLVGGGDSVAAVKHLN
jgi:3-phosphoglycerate kinase